MRFGSQALGVLGAAGALALAGCANTADDPGTTHGRTAQVYKEAIRTVVDDEAAVPTTTGEEGEERPLVFVVTADGSRIDDEVQAKLVQELDPDINLQIQDVRGEAVDETADDEPVRDEGLLILLGPVPAEGDSFDLQLEHYRSLDAHAELVLSFRLDDDWVITSTSVIS